jgi:hypothetical protein
MGSTETACFKSFKGLCNVNSNRWQVQPGNCNGENELLTLNGAYLLHLRFFFFLRGKVREMWGSFIRVVTSPGKTMLLGKNYLIRVCMPETKHKLASFGKENQIHRGETTREKLLSHKP